MTWVVTSLVAVVVAGAGCTTAPAEEAPAAAPFSLRGTYEAKDDGAIEEVTFTRDMHYLLRANGCESDDCTEQGDYAFADGQRALLLTDDATGRTRKLPISAVDVDPSSVESGLTTQDNTPLAGGNASLTKGEAALTKPTANGAKLAGQQVSITTKRGTCLLKKIKTGIVTDDNGKPLEGGECGLYKKKECDVLKPVKYYAADVTRFFSDAAGCVACGGVLAGSAIVAVGGTVGSDGLITVPAGALATTMAVAGCTGCYKSAQDAGVFEAIDCALEPCQYSVEARQQECQMTCQTAYTYVPLAGSACQCTNSATEACCRIVCMPDEETSSDCLCVKKKK